ncbi:hypothetical protein Lpp78_08195 [Lacticaseibacillus paracasei subsp. paracasei CNCM I-2877]|nr:hypothetical protein Lpp78_08195 [Lacticaseibacillus paracasei subsp. paracasei CNCM I-2877]
MSWMDKFDPKLQTMVKEVDAQIAPQLAKLMRVSWRIRIRF